MYVVANCQKLPSIDDTHCYIETVVQPSANRVEIEFAVWSNTNRIKDAVVDSLFAIIVRTRTHTHTHTHTHAYTARHFWKIRHPWWEYNRHNRNYRDSAAEQCVKATSASAFDEQRKRWWRRGRSRGYGKPRGTPSPEQALSSSRESTRYQRALATLEQKPREFFADFRPLFEPRRSF